MIYNLQNDFEKINSTQKVSQYLNKYNGEWFNIQKEFDSIIPHLKKGITLQEVSVYNKGIQDIVFSLIKDGLITSNEVTAIEKFPSEIRDQVTLVIIEALSYCNLACTYCFEDVPTKGFKMSFTTAANIIRSVEQLNLAKTVTIEFNGGESFSNFPILQQIVSEVKRSKKLSNFNIKFGVTTNATFTNSEIINFLKENWFGVTISLDGIKEDHDKYRVFKENSGSFDKVINTLKKFNENNIQYNVISVISSASQVHRTYEFFKEIKIPRMFFAIRRHSDRLELENIDFTDIAQAHYEIFKDSFECFKIGEFAPLILDYAIFIKNIMKPYDPEYMCLRTPCGAGKNMITYDTKGDIYACQDLIKETKFKICSATDSNPQELIDNNPIVKKLKSRKPGGNSGCEECNWQMFCQGGCYSTSYFKSNKDINASFTTKTPHCDYFYRTFERLIKDFMQEGKSLIQYAYLDKNIGE